MPTPNPFSVYTGASTGPDTTALTNAIFPVDSGISASSIILKASGQEAVNYYDGSIAQLGIGAGLLLTSGTTPGTSNSVPWFGTDNSIWPTTFYNGDADIDAVVNTVFSTQSFDATTLEFDFTVTDPTATSVSFDLVFGSDEFPEWVDQFVDSAIVMVNGVNYALFNHDPMHPLSVVSANLAAGYFQDNAGNTFPIEYDGVSHVLKIVAPIIPGGATNHIKIGIADTGDHIYDSGIFIANFTAGNIPGSGVVSTPTTGTGGNDTLTGSAQDEYFDLKGGDDTCYAGAGDDIIVAGAGDDVLYGGSGADQLKGDSGMDQLDGGDGSDTAVFAGASGNYAISVVGTGFTVTDSTAGSPEGTDTLSSVELAKFSDGLFAIGADGSLTAVGDPAVPPANAPGVVVISGVASAGKTLTATVSDPDGVSGTISYQWQVSDGAGGWSTVGGDSKTYVVADTDVGKDIQVTASYTDSAMNPESPVSAIKSIVIANNGDLVVTLMQLDAPVGASTINPLTTLVQDAIELGISPNVAMLAIKSALGLPAGINLLSYDAYAVLQVTAAEPTALAVEKVAVQVAILTSLSDDDTGVNLTLKLLDAAANNQTLDLANAEDLAGLLGVGLPLPANKNDYPQPLREIFDRNSSMSDAIADGGDVSVIEAEWQDFISIQDGVASTSIADLSIDLNQNPVGSASATLAAGLENTDYLVSASDLLAGFTDPDGDALFITGLVADKGTVVDNGDGTFTITPPADFSGPVELTYSIEDGNGGSAPASQMFVIAAGAPPVVITPVSDSLLVTQGMASSLDASVLLGNDSVSPSGSLSVTAVSNASGASVELIGGKLVINANLATGSFDYTVSADTGETATGHVALTAVATSAAANTVTAAASVTAADLQGQAGNDTLRGSAGSDRLLGGADNDKLYGFGGNDVLLGGDGNDLLDGGLGADVLDGGLNNDTYLVDNPGDVVTELPGGGVDLVRTDLTAYTLGADLENLISTGALAFVGTGNALDNSITGGIGNDLLDGAGGNDKLSGDGGDDTLAGGDGNDSLNGGTGNDTLEGGAGNDALAGLDGNDVLRGGGGNDALDGGLGADTLEGGLGDDKYTVDDAGDLVIEAPGGGSDKLSTSLSTYTLVAHVESLTYIGAGAFTGTGNEGANNINGGSGDDQLIGLGGDDKLAGGSGNDSLSGGDGNDSLDGGLGADSLDGGLGNDKYTVDDAGDLVIEAPGGGSDSVTTSLSAYTLGADLENLTKSGTGAFTGTGNDAANVITGGTGSDLLAGLGGNDSLKGGAGDDGLSGGDGNDSLDGGLGADALDGGSGNDTYVVDNAGDVVTEALGAGTDTVKTTLASYTLPDNVENLSQSGLISFDGLGNALANNLTGNIGADQLWGLGGNDNLKGGLGNDVLWGGAGVDSLTGGDGADVFAFAALTDLGLTAGTTDSVRDFSHLQHDLLDLSLIDANSTLDGDQGFDFIGASAFSGTAGELRYAVSGSNATVFGDVDGNGLADFAIQLVGVTSLEVTDFVA